ncbi:hypothetical protein ABFS83_08G122900 [Erythranthe nasuta]
MKITETKQSRLRHYIGAPKKFLQKARDLYVDTMLDVEGNFASANILVCPVTNISNLPKGYGGQNSKKMTDNTDNYLEELYQSICRKYNWRNIKKSDSTVRGREISGYGVMGRSYSIALGKIGTIDEEEPCDFQENVAYKSDIFFPRSRSHAFARKIVFEY